MESQDYEENHLASYLACGNKAMRSGDFDAAICYYQAVLKKSPELIKIVAFNLSLAEKKRITEKNRHYLSPVETPPKSSRPELVYWRRFREITLGCNNAELNQALLETRQELDSLKKQREQYSETPLVSVIMPTFNRASTIKDSILTVLQQSYIELELLVCDDDSQDDTSDLVKQFRDPRIRYLKLSKGGAAAARNAGLAASKGELIAYLDSDNYWHPDYLTAMVATLIKKSGHSAIYSDYIDFKVDSSKNVVIKSFRRPAFNHEALLEKPFIDLNSFMHRRELFDCFGGFNAALKRRQDYDLILKYTWLRDPLHLRCVMTLYQRNDSLKQITTDQKQDQSAITIIQQSLKDYFAGGLPWRQKLPIQQVTILSWDLCRNHFSKPFALAEALSTSFKVQLIAFRFFEEEIFPPLKYVTPSFETLYIPGTDFPDFFSAMSKAVAAIKGEVVYVVKPRLPSLGVALLANALRGVPILLEINDLETVVSAPKPGDHHKESIFNLQEIDTKLLKNPYSDEWSRIMDPIAKQLPVLLTHNRGLNEHFAHRCLYMRNLKDESVYDPAKYDRGQVRAALGFNNKDRIILFGGMLRKHKGIYELVELVKRLDHPAYKLLFVGSRITPDQKKLVQECGDQIQVLPPQDREAMARINLAADLVVLWLNPEVPASHYQMPYKATDAFAMGTHIIANDISDLGELHRQGYLTLVPFADWTGMTKAIQDVFDRPERTERMRAATRRLFLRQFSYAAGRSCFTVAAHRVLAQPTQSLPVAMEFLEQFMAFYNVCTGKSDDFFGQPLPAAGLVAIENNKSVIQLLDVGNLGDFQFSNPSGVAVVMPSIDVTKARSTADILLKRAGMPTTILIAEDTVRQGFIKTLNEVAARIDVRYVVYLAEDVFPGLDWLKLAHDRLEESGKSLLAFNCGKWRGRIAAFGMVRTSWVKYIYDGSILYANYKAHKADNEITVIARTLGEFVYEPDAVLVEIDPRKTGSNPETAPNALHDRQLFKNRFQSGFGGLVQQSEVMTLWDEYLNRSKSR